MKTERNKYLEYGKKERRKKQKRDYATRKRQEGRKIFEDLQSMNKQLHRRNRRRKQQIEKLTSWAMYAKSYLSLCTQFLVARAVSSEVGMTSESGVTESGVTPDDGVTSENGVSSESGMASEDGVTSETGMSLDLRVTSEGRMTSEAAVASEVGVRPETTAMSEAEVTSSPSFWPSADSTVIELGDVLTSGVEGDSCTFKTDQETFGPDTWERQQRTSFTDDDDEIFAVPDSTVLNSEEDLSSVEVHDLKSLVFDVLQQARLKISPDDENFDGGKIENEATCVQFHAEDFFAESFERGGLSSTPRSKRVST